MGPPSLLPRLRWSRARGVENPRPRAWCITSIVMGPRPIIEYRRFAPERSLPDVGDPGGAAASFAWLLRQTPARASQCCFMPRMRVRMSSCERLHSKYVLR